ncbi:MAG: ParB N-terminal domain-containing protein [Deltaproteobacteria bacterium]|nr:ParB N-terminal domain-containing protein [Deltaproteobacteria bacterium]
MGKLTRRVKFIAKERRLSIPAEFLHEHGIERGDRLVIAVHRDRLYGFSIAAFEQTQSLVTQAENFFPGVEHPFHDVVATGVALRLGSQDRIVLPRTFPFSEEQNTRLHWELVNGVLQLEPEHRTVPERPAHEVPTGQRSLLDFMAANSPTLEKFDRQEAEAQLVETVSVGRIDWRDRTFETEGALAPDALLRSIKVEGVRRPVVVREREDGHYQVIDGFRRLAAARSLKMRSLPALVWRDVSEEDCRRLKLMSPPKEGVAMGSPLQRLQSTVRLHEDQVALQEIEHITGRRKRTLQRYLRIAQDEGIKLAVEQGRLSIFKAEEILKAGVDPEEAIREGWTVKTIREKGRADGRKRHRRRQHGTTDG